MSSEAPTTEVIKDRAFYNKKGLKYLLIAAVFFVISFILHFVGIQGGIIFALISLAWVVLLFMGLGNLIAGFFKKP